MFLDNCGTRKRHQPPVKPKSDLAVIAKPHLVYQFNHWECHVRFRDSFNGDHLTMMWMGATPEKAFLHWRIYRDDFVND